MRPYHRATDGLAAWIAVLAFATALGATNAGAVPADGGTIVVRQPDGRTIALRLTGDEHDHAFETLDGFTVLRDPVSGAWTYAGNDTSGALVASEQLVGTAIP